MLMKRPGGGRDDLDGLGRVSARSAQFNIGKEAKNERILKV
jgi:hypothetical protein